MLRLATKASLEYWFIDPAIALATVSTPRNLLVNPRKSITSVRGSERDAATIRGAIHQAVTVPPVLVITMWSPTPTPGPADAPPRRIMNSRRLISDMSLPPAREGPPATDGPKRSVCRTLSVPQTPVTRRILGVGYQAAPLAMMWNTNPSTVIPTATAAIGSSTSAVAFAPFTGPVKVSKSPLGQSRKLR